jgi:hypothetical protein
LPKLALSCESNFMTPQQFVEWGRRIADGYARAAGNPGYEFDDNAYSADDFLQKSNQVARAFTIPGGQERLAVVPALLQLSSQDNQADFDRVLQALQPALYEILEGMWIGEWEFSDSGLMGRLQIERDSAPRQEPFYIVYIDSQGTAHETVVTRDDEEFGMGYESLHIEIKNYSSPAWKIHAFIFRWDRQKMAGIVDHGETEGRHSFYAVKKLHHGPPPLPRL